MLAVAGMTFFLSLLLFLGTTEPAISFFLVPLLATVALAAGAYQVGSLLLGRIRYQRELREIFPRPGEVEVASLVEERMLRLSQHSQLRLGLETIAGIKPLTVCRGIHWYIPGITLEDLVHERTESGSVFGVYSFVAIWLTKFRLAAYACDYNLLRDTVLNEKTAEFFYEDIVSIAISEESSSLTLPTGVSLKTSQKLRIAVANSEFFVVTVDSPELRQLLDIEQPPHEDLDRMLAAVRNKLEERRTASDKQGEGRYSGLP